MKIGEILGRRGVLAGLALVLVAMFLFDIGGRNLSSPDEGRYVEIPREMVETDDFVLPRLNGVLYFEKPPLFYWLEASAVKTLGITEWTMRLWPALLGLFGCWMTYTVGRRFYGRTAGIVSAAVLSTTLLYYALSRFIILDMCETVFMTAALFAFLLSAEEDDDRKALWWARAGHVAAALAVLSKGLIGVMLPGLIGLVWIALIGRWSFVRRALCPSGILIFLVIAVPWHVFAAMRNHDFLWFYFVHEHLMRFTTEVHRRDGPIVYFIPVLAVGFLPWTGYLWDAVKQALPQSWTKRRERPVELFLILWAGIIFAFFSISHSKLPPYILPIFPPLALLVGRLVAPRLEAMGPDDLPIGRYFFAAIFGLLALGVPVAYWTPVFADNEDIAPYLAQVAPYVTSMAIIFTVLAVAVIWLPRKYGVAATLACVTLGGALGWTGVSLVASAADPNSVKPVADAINAYRQPGDVVVSYDTLFYDLPPYIGDKVLVVNNAAEFAFGMTQEDISSHMTDTAHFLDLWNRPEHMFMAIRPNDFAKWEMNGAPQRMCIIKRTRQAIGIANYKVADAEGRVLCAPWYNVGDKAPATSGAAQ